MALNFLKLPEATDAKTRIFYLLAGVVGVSVLGFAAYKFLGGDAAGTATSRVAAAPAGLASVPGSQLTPEYSAALRQQNAQAAQQAQISGGSAVPTLINAGFGQPSGGCTVMCPSDNNPDVANDINDLVKSGKLSQDDANKLMALSKANVTPEEYAAQLDELVREGKLTPEQARKLLADYKKQHANALITESGKYLDGMIKAGLPIETANEVLDLQKRNLTPAEYQAELQRLVREGKLTPEQAAKLLAQYTQQHAAEVAKANQFRLMQMARSGEITATVAKSLGDLQDKNVSVADYAAELDRLVKEGKLTPEAAAKLLAQYKQQKLGAALAGCLGKLMKMGGDKATEAQHLLDMQSSNAAVGDYLDELKRAVTAGSVTPDMAACLLQEYQAATAPVQTAAAPASLVNIPGASDFAKLQQRLQDQQGNQPTQGAGPQVVGADQFAAIASQAQAQAAATASANQQQIISDTEAAMSAQAQQLISTAWTVPTMEHKGAQSDQEGMQKVQPNGSSTTSQSSQSSSSSPAASSGPPLIKAGTIYFAVLDTGADSDYPDTPIMATIVQGPYKGAKLLGKIALAQSQGASAPDRISLTFTLMNTDSWPTSKAVTAFAIDPDTARTVLASNVDYHYMKRYGAIMATAFLSGYASAITNAGSTSTTGVFGTSTTHPQLSAGSKLAVGLGQIGTSLSSIVQNYSTIPPTVKVNAGVGLGILYMADVTQ